MDDQLATMNSERRGKITASVYFIGRVPSTPPAVLRRLFCTK